MKCNEILFELDSYVDGDLSPELDYKVKEHLETCNECMEEYKIVLEMGELLNTHKKELSMPEDTEKRLVKKARKLRKTSIMKAVRKLSGLIAAMIILVALTIATISPAFAQFISNIPGVYQILDWLNNSSIERAIEHHMMQPIDRVYEAGGVRVHFEGFLADDSNIFIFYNVKNVSNDWVEHVQLLAPNYFPRLNDEALVSSFESSSIEDLSPGENARGQIIIRLSEPLENNSDISNTLTLNLSLYKNYDMENLLDLDTLSFIIDIGRLADISETVIVDKVIEVDGQKIHVDKIIIKPTESIIYYKPYENNSKEILRAGFKLIDDKGNVYLRQEGTYTPREDGYRRQNMESPMFVDYKRLYLTTGDFQALNKKDTLLKIDIDNKKIINGPEDIVLKDIYEGLNGTMVIELYCEKGTRLQWYAKDANGNILASKFKSSRTEPGIGQRRYYLMESFDYTSGIITIEITGYPNTITEELKIRIK